MNAQPSSTTICQQSVGKKPTDVRVAGAELYFLPVETRVPLKFGGETLTAVSCARVRLTVVNQEGQSAEGWGETPLSVQWTWPGDLTYGVRIAAMQDFCIQLAAAWVQFDESGHPLELGDLFARTQLSALRYQRNGSLPAQQHMPLLAALACCSPFDVALHDAYAKLVGLPVYETYGPTHLNRDLSHFLEAADASVDFHGKYPADFLRERPSPSLPVWHLVGGLDPLTREECNGSSPNDVHPHALTDWIERDGLKCVKIKLRGDDFGWDYGRVVRVGHLARQLGVEWLTTDFNCMVQEPAYVMTMLDLLESQEPEINRMILYVEQPFPYDMEAQPINVKELSARKPLLMDESADSWMHVRLGRSLGWNGVAIKTCKTQTGALLSLCWAKAHGMHVMVQDLTNPMLAQIPHVLLAAHADTMMGVESNAMQYYPEASAAEAEVHPGLYQRCNGRLDLSTLQGPGFGYRLSEIRRALPPPEVQCFSSS